MITNDRYLAMLHKHAADEEQDNAQAARKEYAANRSDNRRYLGGLFNRAEEVEKQMTSAAGKVLEQKNETGSAFIKVAARQLFNEMIAGGQWAKTASPAYREVAFLSFCNEFEKQAALKGQTMAQLLQKNRVAAATPKVWDLSNPVSAGAGAALKARPMPAGSGTSINQPGLLSRAAAALGFGK